MDLANISADSFNFSLILDIIVLLVLIFSVGIAFLRGFVREVLTIAGLIGGIICAFMFAPSLEAPVASMFGVSEKSAENLIGPIPNEFVVKGVAYGGVMLSVVIILSILSYYLSKKLKDTGLGPIDRTLGVFFGLARAVLVLGFLYLPLYLMVGTEKRAEIFPKSISRVYVEWSAAGVEGILPKDVLPKKVQGKTESELATFTREKLQEIDVLKDSAPKALKTIDGYSEDNRDKLDDLIKSQNINSNRTAPEEEGAPLNE
jgi:membrane protein required for colicin V production